MSMDRVTTLGTSNSLLNYIVNGESRYYNLSKEASSGLKVSKPSDDPSATKSILNVNTQLNKLNSYLNNMSLGQNDLNLLDDSMSSLTDLIDKATDLTTEAANGTYSDSDMDNIKIQIDQIIQSITDLANTQYDGNYIFSGTANATQTYTVNKDGAGNITSIVYNGTPSTGNYKKFVTISDGVTVAVNTTGDQVFGSYQAAISDNPATPLVNEASPEVANGVLGTLMQISNALGTHNRAGASAGLTGLSTALDTVSVTRTKFASVSNRFKITKDSINTTITQLKSYKSDLEDADLSQVLSDLATQQTALQATYSVTSQLLGGTSLLDYLR